MKKISAGCFRNVISNIVIGVVLVIMFFVSYAGGVMNVFTSSAISPFYNGAKNSNKITIMINVYWGTEYLDRMLAIFKKHDVKTTFFVGGIWVSKNGDMLNKIVAEGHEIGNHGYYHKDHQYLSYEKNEEEILLTHKLVNSVCGVEMNLFAPPSGSFSKTTLEVANNLGYQTVMWTRDTIDWRDKDTNLIYQRFIKNAKGGDLILAHPTLNTVEALDGAIEYFLSNGFNLTTVSENLAN